MRRDETRLQAAGVAVVTVGQGTPEQAAWFREQFRLPFPVLADPERCAYAAFGLGDARLASMINPALIRAGARAVARGIVPGRTIGDRRQLPGTFLIDREGIVRWAKPAAHAADLAGTDEIIAAARAVFPEPSAQERH